MPSSVSASQRYRQTLWILTVIFLVIAASRILRLLAPGIIDDEVWSVWQTLGNPAQIISWTPYDWPPLFYLVMGVWRSIVGIHPVADRFFSVMLFMIGLACLYRVVRRLTYPGGSLAGYLAMIAYGGLGYSLHLSTMQRGYGTLLGLMPLALWLAVRYFERSTWRRGVLLALCFAIMYYIHFTSIFAFIMIGLFTVIMYRRKVWRWWLPGLLSGTVIVPLGLAKYNVAGSYANSTQVLAARLPPFPEAIWNLFSDLTGYSALLWAILFVLAAGLILYQCRSRLSAALGLWVLSPVALYLAQPIVGWFFTPRFLWWVLTGFAIWIGWGLSLLPSLRVPKISGAIMRRGVLAACAVMLVVAFLPIPTQLRDHPVPMLENMTWLKQHMQRYDVMLVDPSCISVSPMEWDYYSRLYFPDGLKFVSSPQGYRRIWYVTDESKQKVLEKQVRQDRVSGPLDFVGPPELLFKLYEAPPDPQGVPFENGLRFHGAEFVGSNLPGMMVLHEGESFRLRLWWSVDRPLGQVSMPLFIFRDGALAVQSDGPQKTPDLDKYGDVPQYTDQWKMPYKDQWKPDRLYYVEEREMTIPNPFRTGTYPIYLTVYDPASNTRLAAPGVNADKLLVIEQVNVKEW